MYLKGRSARLIPSPALVSIAAPHSPAASPLRPAAAPFFPAALIMAMCRLCIATGDATGCLGLLVRGGVQRNVEYCLWSSSPARIGRRRRTRAPTCAATQTATLICMPWPAPAMAMSGGGKWTERDAELCREAVESGMVVDKKTGRPLTFAETRAQYDDYEPVRAGLVSYEEFIKDRIEVRPIEY